MINPNKEILLTGIILKNEALGLREGIIKSGGRNYEGHDFSTKLEEGALVTFRVRFSVMADDFIIVKNSVRRRKNSHLILK